MPALGYWKIRGLAQPIRLLLNYMGLPFEDVRYEQGDGPGFSAEQWTKVKYTLGLPFPNLPYYIDGDIKLTQSNAILRHIARQKTELKLMGTTAQEKADVDMMMDVAMDFRNGVARLVYNGDFEKQKEEYKTKCKTTLATFEKWLETHKWFGGANVTVVDFPMYELLDQHRLMFPGIMKEYPKLAAFLDAFEALPAIKKYMASSDFIKRPVNNKNASFR